MTDPVVQIQVDSTDSPSTPPWFGEVTVTCSPAPSGHDHWTLRLLAGKAVELGFVDSISPETIRQLLKKMNSNPGSTSNGACPP